jgi:type I restriction enzyme R subunit
VLIPSYQEFIKLFNRAYGGLLAVAPDLESIDELKDEEAEFDFVTKFRELMRLRNILTSFADFSFAAVKMDEQDFEDYKSKYLDIYDKVKTNTKKEKDSILLDVDFELELIQRDEINVSYILNLIDKLKNGTKEEQAEYRIAIVELLGGDPKLRSNKALIEKLIKEQMANVDGSVVMTDEFEQFWEVEKQASLNLEKSVDR